MGTRATLGTMARKWQYSVKRISTSDSVIRGVSTNYWIFDSNLNSGSLYKLYAGTNRKRKYLYRTLSELLLYLVIALLSRKYKLEFTASWLIYFYLFTSMTCHMTQKIRQQLVMSDNFRPGYSFVLYCVYYFSCMSDVN